MNEPVSIAIARAIQSIAVESNTVTSLLELVMKHDEEASKENRAFSRLKAQATRFGFLCVSTQWQGHYAQYDFVCAQGHAVQRTAGALLYGKSSVALCPDCTRSGTYKRLQILANWKGGICLEADYLGAKVMHRMRCGNEHDWQAEGHKLLAGNWCPICMRAAAAVKRRIHANRKPTGASTRRVSGTPVIDQSGNHGAKQQAA